MWEVYHRVTGKTVESFTSPQDAMKFALRSPGQYAYEYMPTPPTVTITQPATPLLDSVLDAITARAEALLR